MTNFKDSETGCLLTIESFERCVKNEVFIDCDGVGHFAKDNEYDTSLEVWPSQWGNYAVPSWATHVLWFRKR